MWSTFAQEFSPPLTIREASIVKYLATHGESHVAHIAHHYGRSIETTCAMLGHLIEREIVESSGLGCYRLTTQSIRKPKTRGECKGAQRPCPWVSCRYHLAIDEKSNGALTMNFPRQDVTELRDTCSLDIADRYGMTLDAVGQVMNITRERVRQIEQVALEKLRKYLDVDKISLIDR
jgi:hypothetical protein